jgi:hypothetical protein
VLAEIDAAAILLLPIVTAPWAAWIVWRITNEQRSDETWFLHPYRTVPVILAYGAVLSAALLV